MKGTFPPHSLPVPMWRTSTLGHQQLRLGDHLLPQLADSGIHHLRAIKDGSLDG